MSKGLLLVSDHLRYCVYAYSYLHIYIHSYFLFSMKIVAEEKTDNRVVNFEMAARKLDKKVESLDVTNC